MINYIRNKPEDSCRHHQRKKYKVMWKRISLLSKTQSQQMSVTNSLWDEWMLNGKILSEEELKFHSL